ncbi:MAG TPA: DUF1223 domain-containing protein [Reyranella sp.]|jgi:hypothetical protein|nr:DUF1223 domain-containing protein [Reyranella sp.]
MKRRSLLIGSAAMAAAPAARATGAGPWSVELFTSQGCSSCPPADAELGKLIRRPDIVALSFHVDYWDYIGWKDPFASKASTDRQKIYARTLRQSSLYTPEMVFDGAAHEPGTDNSEVQALLDQAMRRTSARATPRLARMGDGALAIALDAFTVDRYGADVTLAVYDRHHSTPVKRGENEGATLDNFNVVRRLEKIAAWDGQPASWTVAADRFEPGQGVAVLVQKSGQGPMLGCYKLEPVAAG